MTAADRLVRADRYLASSRALIGLQDVESSVSRSYYAMFYAARAALAERGITARTHAGVVSEFGRVFVKPGDVEKRFLTALGRALNARLLAEYDEDLTFSETQAEQIRVSAVAFVAEIRRCLGLARPEAER